MRSIALLGIVLFLVACGAGQPPQTSRPPGPPASAAAPAAAPVVGADLDYVIRREERPGGRYAVVIELTFQGEKSGRTELSLPDAWAGEKELYRDLTGLTATSSGARIETGAEPSHPVVVHPPGAPVTIRYEFAQSAELASIEEDRGYRVLVQKDYLHAIGHGLWVTPLDDGKTPRAIHLRWTGFPEGTAFANSFGAGVGAHGQAFRETVDHFRHAVFVAGDFRLHEATVRGKKVSVALRGKWTFSDAEFVDLIGKVVETERAFFNDDDFDRFLVTLLPTGNGCCSYGGTGLTNSFATFVSSNLPIERRMKHLLSHELFHTWNGRRIGRQDPEELVYWFSEGFTDYYAELLSFRSGLISLQEYVDSINSTLRQYHLSPAKNAPNEAIAKSFWSDRAIERLPYQRGHLLALMWNDRIRAQGKGTSIDNVMRDLFAAARDHGTVVSAASVDALTKPYLADGIAADIIKYVEKGETVPSSASTLGPCVRLASAKIGAFELGFDEKASDEAGKIAGVVKGSAAERAGVRDGMKLRRSKWASDPTKPVLLIVVDGEREKTIEYLPQGKAISVPQYRLDPKAYAANPAACEAPLRE
ncbi:MAG: hypothetical protein HOV80_10870 [Polyangiaceae bacterium]|nr:hypothetical protein [Polyangiaceae bacterium]